MGFCDRNAGKKRRDGEPGRLGGIVRTNINKIMNRNLYYVFL